MKKNILLWGAGLVLILLAAYVTNNHSLSEPEIPQSSSIEQSGNTSNNVSDNQVDTVSVVDSAKEQALDFTLTDLDGNQVSLQDFKGKNVYINFWATWCKWCVKEMPDMEKIFQEYKDQDLVILAVDVGEDQEKVDSYIGEKDYSFRILLDSDKSVTRAYGIKSIPVSILIDRNGNVAYKRVGVMNEEQMRSAIGTLD